MFKKFLILLIVFSIGIGIGHKMVGNTQTTNEKNTPYVGLSPNKAFISEIYDKIKENYWDSLSDAQLLELFKLALTSSGANISVAKFENKDQLLEVVKKNNPDLPKVVQSVLSSLSPAGRSGLYTEKQEVQLKNVVENRNPETGKVEPTVFAKMILPKILYLQFKKFSPTSLEEFQKTFDSYRDNNLNSLIFDLRGNMGGAIDATAYFLGYFLGKGQYAFDFYHKGEYLPFKTQTDKLTSLTKYKQIVILIDQNTQSSAEMMAAALKKYHVGVLVGVPTKGWGTVERVFPLDNQISKSEKYSLFLVHSITLRDDNLPIEGRGVEPDINIKENWQVNLLKYFNNQALVNAISNLY